MRSEKRGHKDLLLDPRLLLQEGSMMQEMSPDVFPEEEDFDEEWYEEDDDESDW
jgi:hypothetical protein